MHHNREFIRLFVKHERALRSFARVLLPSWEAVDEVMQESSVVMWNKLKQLQSEDGFLPWAKVIVRFESLRLRRNFARDRHVFSDEMLELLAGEAADVGSDVWEREQIATAQCLEEFASHQRELVLAPYYGEGRVVRLAEQKGCTVNSLYKLLGRLRERLMACIERRLASGVAT